MAQCLATYGPSGLGDTGEIQASANAAQGAPEHFLDCRRELSEALRPRKMRFGLTVGPDGLTAEILRALGDERLVGPSTLAVRTPTSEWPARGRLMPVQVLAKRGPTDFQKNRLMAKSVHPANFIFTL